MGERNEAVAAGPVQQQDHPPSWEEVMNEKKKDEKRKEKGPIVDVEAITVKEAETLTGTQRLIATLDKILSTLRKIVQWSTVFSDLAFMSCSLATLIVGCLILQKHYEIVRVVYISQFSTIGHMLVVISSLNLGLFGPLGLMGTWKSKKSFLKWHNIWLLLNILTHLIFLYMCFHFLRKSENNRKETFKKSFESIYDVCFFNHTSGKCCCKIGKAPTCWEYDRNPKNSLMWDGERFKHFDKIGGEDFNGYLEMHRIFGKNCDTDHTDYYGRTIKAMENGFLYLAGAIIVEGFPLFFGTLTILITEYPEVEDDDEEPERVEAKKKKNGLGVFKKVLIFFIVKRLFLFCLGGVFFLCYYSLKKVTENINIEVPVAGGTANIKLWKLITSIMNSLGFGLMHIQLIEDDTKKRRKRRKNPKGKLGKIVQKTKYFACRRVLLVVFGLLFFGGVILWKLWKKNFKVKIGDVENIDVIEVIWYQVRKVFINDKAVQGNLI